MRREFPVAGVVVCDCDETSLTQLCDRLTAKAFEVLPARTADDALRLCRYGHPEILIIDLGLPEESVRELVGQVRESEPRTGIVVLAPQGVPAPRDLGVDDSLVSPFGDEDLRARLDSLLRRRSRHKGPPIRAGEILLDPERHKVFVGAREVPLAPKEFVLLGVLMTDPTRVFPKEELLRQVWGPHQSSKKTRTLDSHASRLRRKLDPEKGRFVVNCWGVGYSLLPSRAQAAGPLDGPRAAEERLAFGAYVGRLMDDSDLTVPALAERASIDIPTIEAILAGNHPVWLDEIHLLAAALDVSPGSLLLGGGERGGSDA